MRSTATLILGLCATCAVVFAQDPVSVSPKHYQVEFENEHLRVLRSSGSGRAHTPMHSHPENVVVYLTDADVRVVGPDGVAKDSHRQRGDAIWNGGQKHERINLSDKPYELIQVELKTTGMRSPPLGALDPIKVTPSRYRMLVENDRVRVLRAFIGPRAKAGLHQHPPFVAIALTDSLQRLTSESGETRDSKRKAGSVAFNPALKHQEENLTDQPIELVLVELK